MVPTTCWAPFTFRDSHTHTNQQGRAQKDTFIFKILTQHRIFDCEETIGRIKYPQKQMYWAEPFASSGICSSNMYGMSTWCQALTKVLGLSQWMDERRKNVLFSRSFRASVS